MEILIFVSGGIAFGALLVVVWKNSVELRDKAERLAAAEARLASLQSGGIPVSEIGQPPEGTERAGGRDDRTAGAPVSAELALRLESLEAENENLKARLAELEREGQNHEEALSRARDADARITHLNDVIESLQRERTELLGQLNQLEPIRSQIPILEASIDRLKQENGDLTRRVCDFHSSIRDRVKSQIDDLQKLYQDLSAGVH